MHQHGIREVIMACFKIAIIIQHPNIFQWLATWGKLIDVKCGSWNWRGLLLNISIFSIYFIHVFSSPYAQQVPEHSIQPLSKSEHISELPSANGSAYNQNHSPELLMTLECNGNRTSVVTPIIEKQSQSPHAPNSAQSMTTAQTPPTDQHLNRTNWEPLTPPQ